MPLTGFRRVKRRVRRLLRGAGLSLWYHPAYRLPFASIEALTGVEPRRADLVLTTLLTGGWCEHDDVRRPTRVRYEDLARVHTAEWLEKLHDPETLARIFAVDPSDVVVDEVLTTLRLACGATLGAARQALREHSAAVNLLGGFHHAGPSSGGGFCAVNDVAVAIAALRAEGFRQRVVVLDLDAHPPDGTAECFPRDPTVWVGSLSGASWGALPGVDETVLPTRCDDDSYLAALGSLLGRMPPAGLAFVLAGGDVLDGDRLGALALSLGGARRRDVAVHRALGATPSVWLPAGGYSRDAWRLLAGTILVLLDAADEQLAADLDPLALEFSAAARRLRPEELEGAAALTDDDIMASLEPRAKRTPRLLDYYTASGLELALEHYGILKQLRRLGYGNFRVVLDRDERGDRLRLLSEAEGTEHLLLETVLEKKRIADADVLYVHWLTLRHPRGRFSDVRPKLPGQEQPGLGMAREAGQLLARTAERVGLAGVAFRPAWLHTAYAARYAMRFVEPDRQARFQALLRDLGHLPLAELTVAVAEGRVELNGEPYTWEASEMVYWLEPRPDPSVESSLDAWRFTVRAPAGAPPAPSSSRS